MCDKETRFEELAHRWSSSLIRNVSRNERVKRSNIFKRFPCSKKKREPQWRFLCVLLYMGPFHMIAALPLLWSVLTSHLLSPHSKSRPRAWELKGGGSLRCV